MPKGGYRPFSGPRRGGAEPIRAKAERAAAAAGATPLEYMLAVMRDPTADPDRRDRMAVVAAPLCHSKIGAAAKKARAAEDAEGADAGTEWEELLRQ